MLRCDTVPAIRPPLADHLPIITILDLPFPRSSADSSLKFREVDWPEVFADLKQQLDGATPVKHIESHGEFIKKIDDVTRIISEVLNNHLDEKTPNAYRQQWWTKELTLLKKSQNCLSGKSFKLRHVRDHPVHAEYKSAANKFKEVMHETRDQDWKDWLESVSQQDLYIANKYISNKPSDYSNVCIPPLRTTINRLQDTAELNEDKVKALAESFFPPLLLISHMPPDQNYPTLLCGPRFSSRLRIHQVISMAQPL